MGPWEPNLGSEAVHLLDRSLTCSDWCVLHLITVVGTVISS